MATTKSITARLRSEPDKDLPRLLKLYTDPASQARIQEEINRRAQLKRWKTLNA